MLRSLSVAAVLLTASQAGLSQDRLGEAPGPVTMPTELQRLQSGNVQDYWTPERMESAQPRGMPSPVVPDAQLRTSSEEAELPPGPPILVPGWSPEGDELPPVPGESYEINLEDDPLDVSLKTYGSAPTNPKDGPYGPFQRWTMQGRYEIWPRSVHGKLFFSLGDDNYVCSATVIGRNVIATAGHCVSDGSGKFYTNFLFCPGYSQSGPMSGTGCWGVYDGATSTAWFQTADVDYDYACLITNTASDQYNGPIGDRTGWSGVAFNWGTFQPIVQFGYPQAAPFDGKTIQQVASAEWYQVDMTAGGQQSKYVGSDLTGGSSGGGWFLSWRHPSTEYPDTDGSTETDPAGALNGPYLNGVNSHSRCRSTCKTTPPTATSGPFWQEMGSPQFLSSTTDNQDASDVLGYCLDNQ